MKTGCYVGYANRPRSVTYDYHGVPHACRKTPFLVPSILLPTTPPGPPQPSWDYVYDADSMPEGAVPPMAGYYNANMDVSASGGLLHLNQRLDGDSDVGYATYYWTLPACHILTFEVSWARLDYIGPGIWYLPCSVYTSPSAGITFTAHKSIQYSSYPFYTEGLTVDNGADFRWDGPLLTTWTGKLIRDPSTGLLDIYLDNVLIGSGIPGYVSRLAFSVQPIGSGRSYIDLDYLHASIEA